MLLFFIPLVLSLDLIEVKISDSELYNLQPGCQVFHIGSNYQRTEIHFNANDKLKIAYLRYSDVKTDICDSKKCPINSAVCGEINGSDSRSTETIIGACISDLYVYIKATAATSISIMATYLDGPCDQIEETLYAQCGSMNYQECDKCGDDCRLANCIRYQRHDSPEKILQSLCLPYDISQFEVTARCRDYKDVDDGNWKQDCNDSIDIGSVGAGTIIALVFIMMTFFGFVGVVTWYNWKMKMNGVPPIRCHRCCPDVLFPRPAPARPQSHYNPPEISLQSFK